MKTISAKVGGIVANGAVIKTAKGESLSVKSLLSGNIKSFDVFLNDGSVLPQDAYLRFSSLSSNKIAVQARETASDEPIDQTLITIDPNKSVEENKLKILQTVKTFSRSIEQALASKNSTYKNRIPASAGFDLFNVILLMVTITLAATFVPKCLKGGTSNCAILGLYIGLAVMFRGFICIESSKRTN